MNTIANEKHPCLEHHPLVAEICRPLQAYGISFFGFTSLDNQGNAACLGSKAEYAEEYLRQNCVVDDAQYRPQFVRGRHHYQFWDYIRLKPDAERIYHLAAQFDHSHTLTISQFDKDITRCYHFSGTVADDAINNRYLGHLDALHSFIKYFDHCSQTMPEIANIFKYATQIKKTNRLTDLPVTSITDNPKQLVLSEAAHAELYFKNFNQFYLTKNERACLYWLCQGKSADMIAKILKVTRKTIERHIASAKSKYDCCTQFQLGQKTTESGLTSMLKLELSAINQL